MTTLRPPAHRSAAYADQRTGQCKICKAGLYAGQPTMWLRDPMGLSHTDCAAALPDPHPPDDPPPSKTDLTIPCQDPEVRNALRTSSSVGNPS